MVDPTENDIGREQIDLKGDRTYTKDIFVARKIFKKEKDNKNVLYLTFMG